MKCPCSGVILAGGLNVRFSGKNKALLPVGGKRILDRIYTLFSSLFEEIILVTNDPLSYLEWDAAIVSDMFPFRSPLTGIHAGLFYMSSPHAFVVACDTPFLKQPLIEKLVNSIDSRADIIVPETAEGLQPLFSVYSKRCLQPLETHLAQQRPVMPTQNDKRQLQPALKVQQFFEKVHVKRIPEGIAREMDPHLVSFFNINSPEDLVKAEALAEKIEGCFESNRLEQAPDISP